MCFYKIVFVFITIILRRANWALKYLFYFFPLNENIRLLKKLSYENFTKSKVPEKYKKTYWCKIQTFLRFWNKRLALFHKNF